MGSWSKAAIAFENAIDSLPETNLSAVEKRLKKQYEDGLVIANKEAKPKKLKNTVELPINDGNRPWQRAIAMCPEMEARGEFYSSVNRAFIL